MWKYYYTENYLNFERTFNLFTLRRPGLGRSPDHQRPRLFPGQRLTTASFQNFNTLIFLRCLINARENHFLSFFQLLRATSELRLVYQMHIYSSVLTVLWNSLSALWPWLWMENLWGFYVLPVAPPLTTFNALSETKKHAGRGGHPNPSDNSTELCSHTECQCWICWGWGSRQRARPEFYLPQVQQLIIMC